MRATPPSPPCGLGAPRSFLPIPAAVAAPPYQGGFPSDGFGSAGHWPRHAIAARGCATLRRKACPPLFSASPDRCSAPGVRLAWRALQHRQATLTPRAPAGPGMRPALRAGVAGRASRGSVADPGSRLQARSRWLLVANRHGRAPLERRRGDRPTPGLVDRRPGRKGTQAGDCARLGVFGMLGA